MVAAPTITAAESAKRLREEKGSVLVDVRTPAEFREIHAEGATPAPLDSFDAAAVNRLRQTGGAIYVICRSGSRAKQACDKLLAAGAEKIFLVEGGTQAWEAAGLPVKRGKKTMSLERQVRIAAGALVFVGSALAYFVHPYFIGLPAFVGAGLVFAGVTDTCGMGMVIARMPWNRVRDEPTCQSPAAAALA